MKGEIEKRQIRVLIGNSERAFNEFVSLFISKRLGDRYELSFMTAGYGEDLLKLAEEHPFDIFILIPNNILFRRKGLNIKDRDRKVLEIIAHLAPAHGKPMMAISAFWTKDTSFAKKARLAGMNSYLDIPFKPKEFLEPLSRLLEIEPDDGQSC